MKTAYGYVSAAPGVSGNIRRYLGVSQERLAAYLGTNRVRVADEEARRRRLTSEASVRLSYLFLLLPPDWHEHLRPPLRPLPALPTSALPVTAPPLPLGAKLEKDLRWQHRTATHFAFKLRYHLKQQYALADTHAHVHVHRQALLAAFAAPPLPAAELQRKVPDTDPARTARWLTWLTDQIAFDEKWGGPVKASDLARDELKLYLLEAEAATLAAWLGE